MKMGKKHWSMKTFKVVERSKDTGSRHGYCTVCKADMAYYPNTLGLRHYNSHSYAKQLGLNWKRK